MKKLNQLKLNQLARTNLTEQEMKILRGGGTPGECRCGCGYTSKAADNNSANNAKGITDTYAPGGYVYDECGDLMNPAGDKPCFGIKINDNWDCLSPANCNSEPNKC